MQPRDGARWSERAGSHDTERRHDGMQQASSVRRPAERYSEAMWLYGGATKSHELDEDSRDVVIIEMVPCRLSSEIHVEGRHVATTEPAREAAAIAALDSDVQKRARINGATGQETVELGYSTLKSAFRRSIGGGAKSGGELGRVPFSSVRSKESGINNEYPDQLEKAGNLAQPRLVTNPAQPRGAANPALPRAVVNPVQCETGANPA
jgi:hypothetical protein